VVSVLVDPRWKERVLMLRPASRLRRACVSLASLVAFFSLAATTGAVHVGQRTADELFAYDASQGLDLQMSLLEQPDGVAVYDVSYASPKGGRVTALLVTPRTKGRYAGMLFGHWGGGDRAEFLPEAILYARAGVVSLLPAYPWTRPAPWRKGLRYSSDPEHDFDLYVQAVVDLRRGLDLLLA
jgi:hypothetical protein